MYILKPIIHETIWGGNRLKKYGYLSENIGHLYLVNGHKNFASTVLNGECKGKSLKELFENNKVYWRMERYDEFPLTVALVDAREDLSIQVHPDDDIAKKLEGEKIGKIESWIFLEVPTNGWIYGGCRCADTYEIVKAVKSGNLAEVADHYEISKMDCVTVEAGTLHSMSAGSLVYEIEYGSDYTYRFYDFERKDSNGKKRTLHIEKAIDAIKPSNRLHTDKMIRSRWIKQKNYELSYWENLIEYINCSNRLEVVTVISGDGVCDNVRISGGMSVLLMPGEKLRGVLLEEAIIARLSE